MNDDGRKRKWKASFEISVFRAIAELMVKADKGKVTEAEFHAEYVRLAKGNDPVEIHLRVMPLYRQMVGDTAGTSMLVGMDAAGNAIMVEE
jgi:hypothetical protein